MTAPFEQLSFGRAISKQDMAQHYASVRAASQALPHLDFRIVVPQDWSRLAEGTTAPTTPDENELLAAFRKSDQVGAYVTAWYCPWEVDIDDWLNARMQQENATLLRRETGILHGVPAVHADGRAQNGDYLRLMATFRGPYVVLFIGAMPQDAEAQIAETLGLAAVSFEFLEPEASGPREPMRKYADVAKLLHFSCPQSWQAQALDTLLPQKSGTDLHLVEEGTALAYIRVEADVRQPANEQGRQNILGVLEREMQKAGIEIHFDGSLQAETPGGVCYQGGVCALPDGQTGEYLLSIGIRSEAWTTVLMFCPPLKAAPYAWMRGRRAFTIVDQSARE